MQNFLIIGGVHGQEPQAAYFALHLAKYFALNPVLKPELFTCFDYYSGLYENKNFSIIPDFNRYGLKHNTRVNEKGVDLNRNLPAFNWSSTYQDKAYYPGTSPASEIQTQILVKILKDNNFDLLISLHTNHYVKNPNPPQINFDGIENSEAYFFAQKLADKFNLPLTTDIGYSTPGSLGTYCKQILRPCITIEFDDKISSEGIWALYAHDFIKTILV